MTTRTPHAGLIRLDGRPFASLTSAELAVLQRYRKGRNKNGRPWIRVSFAATHLDARAWLHAPNLQAADDVLRRADAVVHVRVYDSDGYCRVD